MPLSDDQLDRYARHIVLKEIGGPGQQTLLKSRVLIIGAGGLGSPSALYLAAAGVGTIGLLDDDTVSLSNLQRQVLFKTADVGRSKVLAGAEALGDINPDITVETHSVRLTPENADTLIAGYDLIVDGCDNFETRFAVNAACVKNRKTLISAAVGRFDGQLATFKPHESAPDGRALPCYQCFVGEPPPPGFLPNCAEVGIIGALTGVMGSLLALEVIKELTGQGSLAGQLLLFDGLSMDCRRIALPPDPNCPVCSS